MPILSVTGHKTFQGSDETQIFLYFVAYKTPGSRGEMKITFNACNVRAVMEAPYGNEPSKSYPKAHITGDTKVMEKLISDLTAISDGIRTTIVSSGVVVPDNWVLPTFQSGDVIGIRVKVKKPVLRQVINGADSVALFNCVLKVTCAYVNSTQGGICLELMDMTSV